MSNGNIVTLFDKFFEDDFRPMVSNFGTKFGFAPAVNVKEFDNRYEITVTAPGINAENSKIEVKEGVLYISYEDKKEDAKESEDGGQFLRQEYSEFVSFARSIGLPKNIDEDSIKANYKNGILKVTVQKTPEAKPKQISVKVEK